MDEDDYGTECLDCIEAIKQGYTICGECGSPNEPWEYTTPAEVYRV